MHKIILPLFAALLCFGCSKKDHPGGSGTTTTPPVIPNDQHISVLTQHNDNTRAGWNNKETKLTTANVNPQHFGLLYSLVVDDQTYAQPLMVGNLPIGDGAKHNVLFIATVNNTVYAYDGDNGTLYWQKNYTASGMRPPKNTDMTGACGGQYQDFSGNIGIVGTPVIDSVSQTMYFVARNTDGNNYAQYLHAINITNGAEMAGSPVKITATYAGNGDGSVNNVLTFDAQRQNQRQALTLVNGTVYVTFSSHCDWGPYHGWILGYNSKTLSQQIVYNDTPNGGDGGIWESGMGLSADATGNLYVVIGNGTVGYNNDPTNLINRGESAMKLVVQGSTLKVNTYFTPSNYQTLEDNDLDYGSMGTFLIPNSNYYVTGCKDGNLYIVNKDNMGGYTPGSNNVQQTIYLNGNANMHCQPSYFIGSSKEMMYIWAENDVLRAIPFDRGSNKFSTGSMVTSSVSGPQGQNGAVLTVSSNGSKDGTGILWATYAKTGDAEHDVSPGILRAFDANNISVELWNSDQNTAESVGKYAKFASATVANGHVYVPTFSGKVLVYGSK